jgi:hypothetical protein
LQEKPFCFGTGLNSYVSGCLAKNFFFPKILQKSTFRTYDTFLVIKLTKPKLDFAKLSSGLEDPSKIGQVLIDICLEVEKCSFAHLTEKPNWFCNKPE